MKQKIPPMPSPQKMANKNPGSNAKVSSDKTATYDQHLAAHQGAIKTVASKNSGK